MDKKKAKLIVDYLKKLFDGVRDDLEKEFNIQLDVNRTTFGTNNATIKIEVSEIDEGGVVQTRMVSDFKRNAELFGLKKSDLNKKIKLQGGEYEIVGLKSRNRKMPIIVYRDGENYKISVEAAMAALGRQFVERRKR
jgi:hypothetical protein